MDLDLEPKPCDKLKKHRKAKAELVACEVLTSSTSTARFYKKKKGPEIGNGSKTESKHTINDNNKYN